MGNLGRMHPDDLRILVAANFYRPLCLEYEDINQNDYRIHGQFTHNAEERAALEALRLAEILIETAEDKVNED